MYRYFTVDEVNTLIPRLEMLMGELLRHAHRLRGAVVDVAANRGMHPNEVGTQILLQDRPELEDSLKAIQRAMEQISSLGGQVKGLDLGLVDFPSELDGQPVLLCWQFGETEVGYYHLPGEGFAGRRPLPDTVRDIRRIH